MKPIEVLTVVLDEGDRVVEVHGSKNLLAGFVHSFPGAQLVEHEPQMIEIALPELDQEAE